jgi:anaerobic selenocysteine-containing dehydrogenase/Fe-S-cluster-containing dehydrogenase component
MSDSVVFSRRDFLKLVGVGVAGAAAGCAKPPAEKLVPWLVAPEDILPGVPYYYASTCRECPVGCGLIAKAREGRVIKLEGNPSHPIGQGGLCARGHAGLQGLYDPDRITAPQKRGGRGLDDTTWDDALADAGGKLAAAKGRTLILTGAESGAMAAAIGAIAAKTGAKHVAWEPFGHEVVRAANERTFGIRAVPRYDLGAARCVVSFGADFLETFGAVTNQARGWGQMRAKHEDGAGTFVAIEPRLSQTGANADEWVAVRPGGETAVALAMAHVILAENLGPGVPEKGALAAAVAAWTPEAAEQASDVKADDIRRLARLFTRQAPGLALAGGISTQGPRAGELAAAVNLLNYAAGAVGRTVMFDRVSTTSTATFAEMRETIAKMAGGAFDVVVVLGANPAYALPKWAGFAEAFAKVPYKVALATAQNETAMLCDLVLPVQHALETFGDEQSTQGVHSLLQPAMRPLPMFDSKPAGDVVLALAGAVGAPVNGATTWQEYVKASWKPLHAKFGAGRDFENFWLDSLKAGGVFENVAAPNVRWKSAPAFAAPAAATAGELALIVTPSSNFFDGRGANRPWLQELPDVTSKTVWGSWAEIHPDTAKSLGVRSGDPVKLETAAGSVEVPAYVYAGIRKDAVALALGQGHTAYGRYATDRGVNAVALLPEATDAMSGALAYQGATVKLSRGAKAERLYFQQEEKDQHGRHIAQVIPISALMGGGNTKPEGVAHGDVAETGAHAHDFDGHYPAGEGALYQDPSMGKPGRFTEPKARPDSVKTPAHAISAYESELKVRSPKQDPVDVGSYDPKNPGAQHRWALAIDLDRCSGCSACVVACNSENNIPIVGPELVEKGREMQWIRIDRFEDALVPGKVDVRFVPMMCQHCGNAPCEMVCPVYATYHNPEGLNAQVYNRCVGTRYCSNNCPYKVRAFNWFDYSAPEKTTFAFPEPLNWQLNPDVTVRSKGVMEKCTMCVQRILEGKGNAKDEKRAVRDGEIQTACAQSCPTQAITFGDLADPDSAVHRKSLGERKYWVLEELNTAPGVTYLQKVKRDTASEGRA